MLSIILTYIFLQHLKHIANKKQRIKLVLYYISLASTLGLCAYLLTVSNTSINIVFLYLHAIFSFFSTKPENNNYKLKFSLPAKLNDLY